MASVKKFVWRKVRKGTSGLQVRVRDLVRKLRPVRWHLRHFLASVDWPPYVPHSAFQDDSESADDRPQVVVSETEEQLGFTKVPSPTEERLVVIEREDPPQKCAQTPDRSMSSLAVGSIEVEEEGRNGGSRPSELTLVVGGGLAPPSLSPSPRNKSPVTVQEWVDSLPLTPTEQARGEEEAEPLTQDGATDDNLTLGAEAGLMCGPLPPAVQVTSCKEPSESGSHCSSVESLLEARKPDPEEVLLSLGFGGTQRDECRIPQRFLQPSKMRGVVIDDFLRQQREQVQMFETGFCGYRGLSGPSHTMPSVIVAKIMERLRKHEQESSVAASLPRASTNTDPHKFSRVVRNVLTKIKCVPGTSVLTPDNRAWLDSQGHKSPETRRRIIIGQQSFTFSNDGDLIESQSPPSSLTDSDRWTSSTGTTGLHKTDMDKQTPGFPSIQEDLTEPPLPPPVHHSPPVRHGFANVVTSLLAEKHQESKLSTSSVEVSDEDKQWSRSMGDSGLPSSGRSSRGSPDNLGREENKRNAVNEQMLGSSESDSDPSKHLTNSKHLNNSSEELRPNNSSELNVLSEQDTSLENIAFVPQSCDIFLNKKCSDSKTEVGISSEQNYSLGNLSEVSQFSGNSFKRNSLNDQLNPEEFDSCKELGITNEETRVENLSEIKFEMLPKLTFSCPENELEHGELTTIFSKPWPSLANELKSAAAVASELESVAAATSELESVMASELVSAAAADNKLESAASVASELELATVVASELESSGCELESMAAEANELESVASAASEPELAVVMERELVSAGAVASEVELATSKPNEVEELVSTVPSEAETLATAPVKVIESLDKVIESLEKIMEPLEVITESEEKFSSAVRLQSDKEKLLQYHEGLRLLQDQLKEVGVSSESGSSQQFLLLTENERSALQCRVVRQALSVYQAQLAADSSHYQLKCCLGAEVHRLSDLLDTTADSDKLATLVTQMTELLKHQAELNSQLKEWNEELADELPTCQQHQLCEAVLRRLRTLELIVQRNSRALSELHNRV